MYFSKCIIIAFSCLILSFSPTAGYAGDRYSNDTEYTYTLSGVSNFPFQAIIHYYFYISSTQTVTLETKNSAGDTYMHLWSETEHQQIAKDDDSGDGMHSRIVASLSPGGYQVFIRSYGLNNIASTCDLYKDGVLVLTGAKYAGTKIPVSSGYGNFGPETRFKTDSLSAGSDTYLLLLNGAGDVIAYNDDSGSLASMLVAAEQPSNLILGAYSPYSEGSCAIKSTQDLNPEYLSLCGNETRHAEAGNTFIQYFNSGTYYYPSVLQSQEWEFLGDTRMSFTDGVDLAFLYSHGDTGGFSDFDLTWVDFTSQNGSSGSGHRTNNLSGDLEYMAILSCKTVRIEDETTWDWLRTRGWQSYYAGSVPVKQFFDGAHLVVGYHTNHNVFSRWYRSDNTASYWYEAANFADYLDAGWSIWEAWKAGNRVATDAMYNWLYQPNVDIGEISSIYIGPSKDERFLDHRYPDYKLGDPLYYFGWRKNHYWR